MLLRLLRNYQTVRHFYPLTIVIEKMSKMLRGKCSLLKFVLLFTRLCKIELIAYLVKESSNYVTFLSMLR